MIVAKNVVNLVLARGRMLDVVLQGLILGGNKFEGNIPDFIGDIKSLELLDLTNNNFI